MSSVRILSINIHSLYLNYGAALHSFAFQKYLEKCGIDSVIVDYRSKHFGDFKLDNPAVTFWRRHSSIKTILNAILNTPSFRRKFKTFHRFYKENCTTVDNNGIPYTYEDFFKEQFDFDFPVAVCESDVIWSPKTSGGFDRVFFCDCPCFEQKIKVAYAPSISNTVLSDEQESEFEKLLHNFDYLSCREKQTAEYVQTLTGRQCIHALDPVLLLDGKEYEPYMERQKYRKYLLAYNVMKNDKKMIRFAMNLAKQKCLHFIELSDFVRNKFSHKTLTGRSIGEFLWLIKNADYVVTNGFHGMCFCLLFQKDFLIFERDGIDLKVKSLLDVLELSERFVLENHSEQFLSRDFLIDWEKVHFLLNEQRRNSMEYIHESIIENVEKHNRGGVDRYKNFRIRSFFKNISVYGRRAA